MLANIWWFCKQNVLLKAFYWILQSAVVVYLSLQRPSLDLHGVLLMSCDECPGCCPALFYSELCWWMLCCAILYPFSALLCCANMDWPIGYGWQGTVWADRCLGQSCWAGLVLTGGLGWMDPCSRASRGGGPKSRLEPRSETVMRGVMCQDWTTTPPAISIDTQFSTSHLVLSVFFASLAPLTLYKTLFSPISSL